MAVNAQARAHRCGPCGDFLGFSEFSGTSGFTANRGAQLSARAWEIAGAKEWQRCVGFFFFFFFFETKVSGMLKAFPYFKEFFGRARRCLLDDFNVNEIWFSDLVSIEIRWW